jgi:general secretion pathway protein J
MAMKRTGSGQSGFTLLEVLVAMAVFATLAAVAYAGLGAVSEQQQRLVARSDAFADVQRALRLFERDIRFANHRGIRDALGSPRPALLADARQQGLELTRSVQFDEQGPGLVRIAYRLKAGALVREQWPVLDRMPQHEPQVTVLLDSITKAQWHFLDNNQWRSSWPAGQPRQRDAVTLPAAVELILETDTGESYRRVVALAQGF